MTRHAMNCRIASCLLGVVLSPACGGGSSNNSTPTGPTATPTPTSQQPFDGIRLVDGAGNAGPVAMRLDSVTEPPGLEVASAPLMVGFRSQFCMDAVPNPTNSPYLSKMEIRVYTSLDGVTPFRTGSAYSVEGLTHFEVTNGSCVTIKRMPVDQGGTPGHQFVFFWPKATYLMFAAKYGPWTSELFFPWRDEQCPSVEAVATSGTSPGCVLRKAYFLDYRWADNLPGPMPSPAPTPEAPPTIVDDHYTTNFGQVLTVPAPGVLSNDAIPAGVNVLAVQFFAPTNIRSFTNAGGGGFSLNPGTASGVLEFQYIVYSSGGTSNRATVSVTIRGS